MIPEHYYIPSEQLQKRHHQLPFVCQNHLKQDFPWSKQIQKLAPKKKRKIGKLEREYIRGFIQNPYHDYRHILDIRTILSFGNKLQKKVKKSRR